MTTFNEWGEGTAIESADEWGTAYLDALSGAPPPPPAPLPPQPPASRPPPPALGPPATGSQPPLIGGRPTSKQPASVRKRFRLGAVKFKRTNVVIARVSCLTKGKSPCKGKLTLIGRIKLTLLHRLAAAGQDRPTLTRVTLARNRIAVKARQAKTIRTRLNKTGRKLNARLATRQLRSIRVTVKATLRDANGQMHTTKKPLAFRA